MNATSIRLRLRKDGLQLVDSWTAHLDQEKTKDLQYALRSALRAAGVDLDDQAEVDRFVLEVRGHLGWFDFRGIE